MKTFFFILPKLWLILTAYFAYSYKTDVKKEGAFYAGEKKTADTQRF